MEHCRNHSYYHYSCSACREARNAADDNSFNIPLEITGISNPFDIPSTSDTSTSTPDSGFEGFDGGDTGGGGAGGDFNS